LFINEVRSINKLVVKKVVKRVKNYSFFLN